MTRASSLFSVVLLLAGCATAVHDSQQIQKSELTGICYRHHVQMKKEQLRISYGLIGIPEKFREAQLSEFPFAHRAIWGGCEQMTFVGDPGRSSPESAEVYVCPQCDAAKERWLRWNPNFRSIKENKKEPNQSPEPTAPSGRGSS